MKIRLALLSAAILFVVSTGAVWAQSNDEQHGSHSVKQILGEIRSELKLGPSEQINPNTVPESLMVELGDAVMDIMIPNQQQHEYMDQMMGGEGSQSLDSMHRWIAYRYLTGGYSGGGFGYGMMGGGMMGSGSGGFGGFGMMGNPDESYSGNPYQSPEQIVKSRYARGEITREQYLQMMKDLEKTAQKNGN
jgi:hypothetical protein